MIVFSFNITSKVFKLLNIDPVVGVRSIGIGLDPIYWDLWSLVESKINKLREEFSAKAQDWMFKNSDEKLFLKIRDYIENKMYMLDNNFLSPHLTILSNPPCRELKN